ncbi:MAG: hypothetical protein M0R73_09595 [Dehalococcoidia bacterium]|nr:hypothetical protein [Dehalococcoidia bacterium]
MLFSTRFHEPIRRGEVTDTFRRWKRPQAKVGGRYRLHTGGVLEATSVEVVAPVSVTDADARQSGFASAQAVLEALEGFEGDLYRVQFRYLGDLPDERVALAADDDISGHDFEEITQRLGRMDGGGRGAWTRDVLHLIADQEGVRAADLAARLGRETVRFKADVRRLKALGLTESLEVGYRLSPRGRALLALGGRRDSVSGESRQAGESGESGEVGEPGQSGGGEG